MEYKKLDDIFLVIRNGANIKQTPNKTGKPITRIETIVDNKIDLTRVGYADILNDNYEDFYLKDGDILMSHINSVSHLGKAAIFENIGIDIIHGMNLLVLKSDVSKVFPKYSYYYFLTNVFRKQLIPITKKSVNQASFNISDLKEIQIPIPSYENQIRIANLLEKIESTIAERKNAIDLLDELVKATFYQMFGDPVRKNTNLFKLKNLTTKIGSGSTPKGGNENYKEDGISLIRSLNVYNNVFSYDKLAFIDEEQAHDLRNVTVEGNDVLLNITGASVARCCIVPNNILPARVNQHVSILRFDKELVHPIYANYLLTSESFQSFLKKISLTKSTTREALTKEMIEELKIYKPSIELQNQFANIAQKIEGIKAEQEAQLKYLEELYASVSQKVFERDIDLSKVPFDANLLPNIIEIPKKEPVRKPDIILQQEVPKEQIKKVIKPTRGKLSWESISFKEVADYIQHEFDGHYFNAEMLLRFLREEIGMFVNYFSSAEQKKNPQYENADDFYRFIATALTGENHFMKLEQVFYNAETENIPNISFTETDLENLSKKDKKERSGIYFRIKDEITTP
ncbi:restriction endonuclease subunit S [Nodularia spumigena CS-584]|nr:restriction endonuclease subunit S [Nodularia spumigena CS-584]